MSPIKSKIQKKVEKPVGKNKPIGHPAKNSGYAEQQPAKMNKK